MDASLALTWVQLSSVSSLLPGLRLALAEILIPQPSTLPRLLPEPWRGWEDCHTQCHSWSAASKPRPSFVPHRENRRATAVSLWPWLHVPILWFFGGSCSPKMNTPLSDSPVA